MKRASIGIALLVSGFLAGLVLTGRLRSADESVAQTVQRPGQTAAIAAPAAAMGGLPDLTGVAAQAVKGVVHLGSAGGSPRERARTSLLRVFFRPRCIQCAWLARSPDRACWFQDGHRHQQPRDRR